VEPYPVGRDSVPADEEPAEEKKVGKDRNHHREPYHHVRHHSREERDEGASGPEGGHDHQKVKDKA